MSDQTHAGLDDAIRNHIADECDGQLVMNWVLVTWAITPDGFGTGAGGYWREVAQGQPQHVTDGLLRCGERITDGIWNDADEDQP